MTFIFALILSLPVLLLQAYGFFVPAFDPGQRRRMLPVTCAIPILFVAGVAFGYMIVLPAALHFFQNFNSDQFNVLVQASQYYKFAATVLLVMGLQFQISVGIIAVTRAGLITPSQLRRNRRYAVLACGLVATVLPGDAITMLLEVLPLYVLFELSLIVAAIAERRSRGSAAERRPVAVRRAGHPLTRLAADREGTVRARARGRPSNAVTPLPRRPTTQAQTGMRKENSADGSNQSRSDRCRRCCPRGGRRSSG